MIFRKKAFARHTNEFSSKADVAEVLTFVKAQRVPGELVVSLPGNGGVAGIVFREKEQSVGVAPEEIS
jgi:hypothetical protein